MAIIKDQEQRNKIVTSLDKNIFVEAGAGSGKTTSLVKRITMLILKGKAKIGEIAAITFTNEGAANLKVKIRESLEQCLISDCYKPEPEISLQIGENEKKYIRDALADFTLAKISTVHSFCFDLLKERPVEAGIDPSGDIVIEEIKGEVFDDFWEQYLGEMDKNNPLYNHLTNDSISLADVKEYFKIASNYPELQISANYALLNNSGITKNLEKSVELIINKLESLRTQTDDSTSTGANKKRLKFINNAISSLKSLAKASIPEMEIFRNEYLVPLKDFGAKKLADVKTELERVNSEILELITPFAEKLHAIIANEAESFRKNFIYYKKQNSLIGFSDLLFLTRELLKNREVRNYFKERFTHFFIDETQDTDPLQTEIVFYLCEQKGDCTEEWKNIRLAQGKLFMVGDPKQSIYRFRRADIQIYELAKSIVIDQQGIFCELTTNFRSNSNIINLINSHFESSFSKYNEEIKSGLQARFIPLEKSYDNQSNEAKNIFILRNKPKVGKKDDRTAELDLIPKFIKYIVKNNDFLVDQTQNPRQISYKDILVLFRKGTHLKKYLDAFENFGIPYFETDSKFFFNDQGVRSIINVLSAIDDFTDTVSLYGALKSTLFGHSDDEIINYITEGNRLSLSAVPPSDPEAENSTPTLSKTIRFLRELSYKKDTFRASGILQRIYDFTDITWMVFEEINGPQKTGKYLRMVELLLEIEEDPALSYTEILLKLKKLAENSDSGVYNISTDSDPDAIRIMTIHKAKGLEAKVIILADGVTQDDNKYKNHFTDNIKKSITIPIKQRFGFIDKSLEEYTNIDNRQFDSEEERLRYVALTRAEDHLLICLPGEGVKNGFYSGLKYILDKKNTIDGIQLVSAEIFQDLSIDAPALDPYPKTASKKFFRPANDNSSKLPEIKPNYFMSVHDLIKIDKRIYDRPILMERGPEFGSIMHKAIEKYLNNKELKQEKLYNLSKEIGLNDQQISVLIKEYTILKNHNVINNALDAEQKYCEWNYFLTTESGIINGVIDLLYKTPEGWVIVDFKTDDLSDASFAGKIHHYYQNQVDLYAKHFAQITGEPVVRKEIIYTYNLN